MELRGKEHIEKMDVLMYKGIYALANNEIQKVDEELIPTFIIEEALAYFSGQEKYEMCQSIQSFFMAHPTFTIKSSREEWFGVDLPKKPKKI